MIEQKQGHHHKQTNSRPMRGEEMTQQPPGWGEGGWVGGWGEEQQGTDVYSSVISAQLYTKHGFALKAVTNERDDVSERGATGPPPPHTHTYKINSKS